MIISCIFTYTNEQIINFLLFYIIVLGKEGPTGFFPIQAAGPSRGSSGVITY